MTAAHAAAEYEHLDCFMYLFEHGASLQIPDRQGGTAMDYSGIEELMEHQRQVSAAFPKKILYSGHHVVLMPLT